MALAHPLPVPPALSLPRPARVWTGASLTRPAFLVAVGYMDPGNWGTDLAAGSGHGYRLVWVLVLSGVVATFLQYLAAKLGIVTGRDLATLVGDTTSTPVRRGYTVLAVVAMLATETAEFLGVVIALRLLLGVPLLPAVALGAVIVVGLLAIGTHRRQSLEWVVIGLLTVVMGSYLIEVWLSPPGAEALAGLVPGGVDGTTLPIVVGIVGATVMPHNLFLHSGLLATGTGAEPSRAFLRRVLVRIVVALTLALMVNVAIVLVAASTFHARGVEVASLSEAHATLTPLLGPAAAGVFAIALLASGLSSSVTGGLATQYVLRGLLRTRWLPPVVACRLAALVPAVVLLAVGVGEIEALVLSQVVLALALPAVVVPLVLLTRRTDLMGPLANGRRTRIAAAAVAAVLSTLSLAGLAGLVL